MVFVPTLVMTDRQCPMETTLRSGRRRHVIGDETSVHIEQRYCQFQWYT